MPGVAPFSSRGPSRSPDPVPAKTMPGVRCFRPRRSWLLAALLALPLLARAQPVSALVPASSGLAECRRVERYAGHVADAAAVLGVTASVVVQDGRLHSLQRLNDRLADLDRSILDLDRAVADLEGAVVRE